VIGQWVCVGESCECSGEAYSCNCVPLHGDCMGVCLCCREPMREIDADTGRICGARYDFIVIDDPFCGVP